MTGADWLSYSLQDFIMFGPQVLLRLFVRINQELWPWPLLAVLIGFTVPALVVYPKLWARRLALGLVALAWMSSGYGFLVGYFGPINWPAAWFGWGFVVQGMVLGVVAIAGPVEQPPAHSRPTTVLAFAALWLLAVAGLPWLTVAEASDWRALGLFGLAPGTTVVASLLVVGLVPRPWRRIYPVLPLLWCLFSAATFWVLQTWWLLGLPLATLIYTGLGFWLSPSPARSRG